MRGRERRSSHRAEFPRSRHCRPLGGPDRSKIHMAVDTLGHLLALLVTPANEQERAQVAALADEVFIAHAAVGGHLETLARRLRSWDIPLLSPSSGPLK